ncbi:YceK/YidQ family lipoprotein [Vibrio sp. IRLE0018]|uniref:YceK/YidQ family lipoprotein n=1 Tax=Vibrio TaxID=662 RepID=UPI001592F987|nr:MULTISPECIES: YceK/YidQ family lipoprotein [Vibrio]MCF8780043.1 YceK/YidQ family lipoprotein [Vibrio floridensis]NVC63853.1 YceK/YidQ family lipoprotein [Vibrio sp. 05-20-BW147]HAS6349496.1 YceK/YidQ family lipoprotein [Vibrio vulnificus]
MKLVNILILVILLSGCSSIVARSNGGEFGHPFSGPIQSILLQPCGFVASGAGWFIPYPLVLADIPISLVTDVVLLPIDLVMMSSAGPAYSNIQYYPASDCMFGGQ